MKRSAFLLICAIGSFGFGAMMFFIPSFASSLLGLDLSQSVFSVLRGMGGLIIGTGLMNLLFKDIDHLRTIKALLMVNIFTHILGLGADIWGITSGLLTIMKMAAVELTHIFIGLGSFFYLVKLKSNN